MSAPRKNADNLRPCELAVLSTAYGQEEGVYGYDLAQKIYELGPPANGSVYRLLGVLTQLGLLEEGAPVLNDTTNKLTYPYHLTVIGVVRLSEAVPDLPVLFEEA